MPLGSPGSIVNIQNASKYTKCLVFNRSFYCFVQETLIDKKALCSKITLFLIFPPFKTKYHSLFQTNTRHQILTHGCFLIKEVFYFSFKLHVSDKI